MQAKAHQILLQFPDSGVQTLTLDHTQAITLHSLKLSLFPNNRNLSSFYFTLNGKPLHDSTLIPNHKISRLSTLVLHSRLPGGGGDGGATGAESRDCYLNMYADKKPDKVDPNEQRLSKWLNCALSNEPLTQPCVIDRLGNIFNKEALVEALIGKKLPKEFGYIKGLKDMLNIKLEPIPGEESNNARFHCPITGLEFNGKYKFFALKNCGHVLSAKALKEEVAVLRVKMKEERLKVKDKKPKKVKNGEVAVNGEDSVVLDSQCLSGKKHGLVDAKGVEKVVGEVEANGKVETVKGVTNGGAAKRFKAADRAPANANKEVYASIFTSSKKSDFKETFTCRSLPLGRN
ncbi:hypothetical protein GH714_010339 [Hevea brasiliensis]|uniref:Ubiquitin-like domain-containing protein n=1 Tax=Hevea brasiliensis TaxID=3981 RepID=A0A6A6MD87_HEVBR|nr:hypothetical protein GH714_010339 [Hevea brasiliensis]